MKTTHLQAQYALLKENSPSVLGYSVLMFIYRIVGFLLAIATIVFGIALLINATVGARVMVFITGTPEKLPDVATTRITIAIALFAVVLGVLFFIISLLAKRIMSRNGYIIELEALAEEAIEDPFGQAV